MTEPESAPTLHPIDACAFCANDAEQCHADMDCEHRATGSGYCFGHRGQEPGIPVHAEPGSLADRIIRSTES